jgi:hypothetical protein
MEGAIMATEQQIPALVGGLVKKQVCLRDMPVDDAQWVIQNPEAALRLLIRAVANRNENTVERASTVIVKKTLKVWMMINTGGTNTEELLNAIEVKEGDKEKNQVGYWARDLTTRPEFVISSTPSQVGLVVLTPYDLGFRHSPLDDDIMTEEFCAKWSANNLDGWVIELCEPEDGPQLRLQYQDQSKGEGLWIAMKPITGSDGKPNVFRVDRAEGGVRWLDAGWVIVEHDWPIYYRFVFRLRKLPLPSAT